MAARRLGVWRRISVALVKPPMLVLTRREWRGLEHLPTEGGVILAANHISHFDPFVLAHYVYERGRWPRFLAKASLFDLPVAGKLMHAVQQIPVHRGTANAARALDDAIAAVRAGKAVIIYPEGTTTRDPDLWPMRAKTGVGRLALATGAPVVPIVTWGAQRVYDPRDHRLRLRPRTLVTVVAGPPIDVATLGGVQPPQAADVTEAVMVRLREMLAEIRGGQLVADDVVTGPEARS